MLERAQDVRAKAEAASRNVARYNNRIFDKRPPWLVRIENRMLDCHMINDSEFLPLELEPGHTIRCGKHSGISTSAINAAISKHKEDYRQATDEMREYITLDEELAIIADKDQSIDRESTDAHGRVKPLEAMRRRKEGK